MSLPHFGTSGFDGSLAHGFLQHALMFMVFFVVEKYVLFDPIQVGLFCFVGILFQTNCNFCEKVYTKIKQLGSCIIFLWIYTVVRP